MYEAIFAIKIGGAGKTKTSLRNTIDSIENCFGDIRYLLLVSLDSDTSPLVKEFVLGEAEYNKKLKIFGTANDKWSSFVNKAISIAASKGFKFFFLIDQNVEVLSRLFFEHLVTCVDKSNSSVGWISFTDNGWRNGDVVYSTQNGWFIDSLTPGLENKLFQFHKFPQTWHKPGLIGRSLDYVTTNKIQPNGHYRKPASRLRNYDLDMPSATCRSHGPCGRFAAISDVALQRIGPCRDWGTRNAFLADEDWGLRAVKLGFKNIWIPQLHFQQNTPEEEHKIFAPQSACFAQTKKVEQAFFNEWGFYYRPTREQIKDMASLHGNEGLAWNVELYSFEWCYDI